MTDETSTPYTDEYGTAYFGDREFDGWVAKRGHGQIRRGDIMIYLDNLDEMKMLHEMLSDMIAYHETHLSHTKGSS